MHIKPKWTICPVNGLVQCSSSDIKRLYQRDHCLVKMYIKQYQDRIVFIFTICCHSSASSLRNPSINVTELYLSKLSARLLKMGRSIYKSGFFSKEENLMALHLKQI